jgi:hypothetical protein
LSWSINKHGHHRHFLFLLAIVLSVLLRFTDSDYPCGIFKLFFQVVYMLHRCEKKNPATDIGQIKSVYLREQSKYRIQFENWWLQHAFAKTWCLSSGVYLMSVIRGLLWCLSSGVYLMSVIRGLLDVCHQGFTWCLSSGVYQDVCHQGFTWCLSSGVYQDVLDCDFWYHLGKFLVDQLAILESK